MNKFLLTLTFLLIGASSAFAVNLINKDSGGYEVRVTPSGGQPTDISIDGFSKKNICKSNCKVEVKGVDRIDVEQGETVVIENGTLKTQSQ